VNENLQKKPSAVWKNGMEFDIITPEINGRETLS
jgi:hypothetical protein